MGESPIPDFTPVHLLTGFLGSGKTTVLSRLLRDPALADTAVLINEFGEIGLDHHLVERVDETVVLLGSGCICCTVRGELSDAIRSLLSQRERGLVPAFRRIVIETTGLADPGPVIGTLTADPMLRHHVRLGAVVATVDAVNGADTLARHPESVAQVAAADRLVLTKTDLADAAAVETVTGTLRSLNPTAGLVRSAEVPLDAERLLSVRPNITAAALSRMRCLPVDDPDPLVPAAVPGPHTAPAESFSLTVERPLDWSLFGLWLSMLLHRHGAEILRVKGILNIEGTSAPVAIHGVQHLVHPPTHLPAWPDADHRSKLVFIVRGLQPTTIRRSLAAFGALAADGAGGSASNLQ